MLVVSVSVFCVYKFKPDAKIISLTKSEDTKTVSSGAAIVPHLDTAKTDRQKFLNELSQDVQPQKIVLLSVNHFDSSADFLTSGKNWDFLNQKISIDTDYVNQLIAAGIIEDKNNVFDGEHGIKNVLPDLANTFPEAKITPLVVKTGTSQEALDKLLTQFQSSCPECYFVGSVDFSHYQTSSLAEIHDQTTLDALESLDEKRILTSETDSPEILYLLAKWAKSQNLTFKLFANSNSGKQSNIFDTETTSWIIGRFVSGEAKLASRTTFLFGGDLMFDRMVNHRFKDIGFSEIFSALGQRVFSGCDIRAANLEGPISDQPINDDISSNNLSFNFPPESLDALKYLKFNVLSLSNNHSQNAGISGLNKTIQTLTANGIKPIGSQTSFDDSNIVHIDTGAVKVAIIAANMLENIDESKIVEAVKAQKAAGNFVIFFPHWGNEYSQTHSRPQADLAHKLIDEGADLIIGSHPHVIQDSEIYKNKLIVYSLGNFVFDQTFSKETQQGVMVGGVIQKDSLRISFFPFEIKNYKPQFLKSVQRESILRHVLPSGVEIQDSDTINLKL